MFKVWLMICLIGIVIGLIVGIGMTQLVLLVAIACMGLALEVANTGIEKMMDVINPQYSEKVKIVKDLYGAVPAFVYSAYVISWLILVAPKIFEMMVN
jgi:diacylglycerol kinase